MTKSSESSIKAGQNAWAARDLPCRRDRGSPAWRALLDSARRLTDEGRTEFTRSELLDGALAGDPSKREGSLGPVLQGMTANAPGGVPSACGEVFIRVGRGRYALRGTGESRLPESALRPNPRSRQVGLEGRVAGLIGDFGACVDLYDREVPFVRSGQQQLHRLTIERRRELGSILAAIEDPTFISLFRSTLRKWGIGTRGSRQVGEGEFVRGLRYWAPELSDLEGLAIEDLGSDAADVSAQVYRLVAGLPVVENKAKVVAGTKTLHHLLPDLVPPMDRAGTGEFFRWQKTTDFQYAQEKIFTEGFIALAGVAQDTRPSSYVGEGWRTSQSKVLDNAVIGWCKFHELVP